MGDLSILYHINSTVTHFPLNHYLTLIVAVKKVGSMFFSVVSSDIWREDELCCNQMWDVGCMCFVVTDFICGWRNERIL